MNDGKKRQIVIEDINRIVGDMALAAERCTKADAALETVLLDLERQLHEQQKLINGRLDVAAVAVHSHMRKLQEATDAYTTLLVLKERIIDEVKDKTRQHVNHARSELGTAQAEYDKLVLKYDKLYRTLNSLLPDPPSRSDCAQARPAEMEEHASD